MRSFQHATVGALDHFLIPWKKKKVVTGALIAGSIVTGKPNPRSGIDAFRAHAGGKGRPTFLALAEASPFH